MKNKNIEAITKAFILNERFVPDHKSSVQALEEILTTLSPRSSRDRGKVQLAKEQLNNIKKHFRGLNEELEELREQVAVLEEYQSNTRNKTLNKART